MKALPPAVFTALAIATCLVPSETPPIEGFEIPLVMGWMLLVTWAAAGLVRRELCLRLDAATLAMLAFFVWLCVSSAMNLGDSRPRATLNMTFRWLSFGVMFFLARQLFHEAKLQRAIIAGMLALAAGIAALGIFHYAVTNPANRARYEADPLAAMHEAGVMVSLDSPAAQQFRDRVYSVEPQATFALTNSLAGFLTPWVIVALALAWQLARPMLARATATDLRAMLATAGIVISLFAMAFCLLLTKSRSAWGAVAIGTLLLLAGAIAKGLRADWKWLAGGGLALALLVAAAAYVGGVDHEVLSEALKSLSYRWQYWQATAAMIADHRLLGIGVGNFQEHYAAYKLPEASEMIGDPHNFLLEIAATMGLPGLVLFVAALLLLGWIAFRSRAIAGHFNAAASEPNASTSAIPIYVGVALGFVLVIPLQVMTFGPSSLILEVLLVVMPATAVALLALTRWIDSGTLPLPAMTVALMALLINLLAAGGIGFASVSLPVWLLAALILASAEETRSTTPGKWHWKVPLSRRVSIATVACCGIALTVFYSVAYRPVLKSRIPLQSAEMLIYQGQYGPAGEFLSEAAQADPWNDVPFRHLALAAQRQWLHSRSDAQFREFEQMAAAAASRNPHSHVLRAELSQRYLEAYRSNSDEKLLAKAIVHQQAAVDRYPNDSLGHAQLAWLLSLARRTDESISAANRALTLDALNPHADRELANQKLFDAPGQLPEGESALETVRRLADASNAAKN